MGRYVAAIDQGTTSTRCMLFDHSGRVAGTCQREHRQLLPRPGWVEHDPAELWQRTGQVVDGALRATGVHGGDLAAVGITNQRETTVAWNRDTGRPYHPAIVWQDTRTDALCRQLAEDGGVDRFRTGTGLPLATYFSAPKMRWLLDRVPALAEDARAGRALLGTVDSWLIWNLTGGPEGGRHVTDVTNASRTQLLNLGTLDWDPELLATFGVPRAALPTVVSSSHPEAFGVTRTDGPFGAALPLGAALGDQQAALVGQTCFAPGEAKSTYGTGCFLLLNTGREPVASHHGLLTTVAYRLGDEPAAYALEGSVAVAGALVQWLRDELGLIDSAAAVEALARTVPDNGDAYLVPAFSGLFAPHWRSDARGALVGLTRFTNRGHLARAALEATAFQCEELIRAMTADSGVRLTELRVDGGMVANELLMQFQADLLGVPVARPAVAETTALGAAYAAGLAVGFWSDRQELRGHWSVARRWEPQLEPDRRRQLLARWQQAVQRALGWVDGAADLNSG
jgi:glycerol kinase